MEDEVGLQVDPLEQPPQADLQTEFARMEGEATTEYLQRLEQSGKFLFHGSSNSNIAELEPRQASDTSGDPFKNDIAVYASAQSAYAILRALIPSKDDLHGEIRYSSGMRNGIPNLEGNNVIVEAFGKNNGYVYVLPRTGFEESVEHRQWKSQNPVKPVFVVEVSKDDFNKIGGTVKVV